MHSVKPHFHFTDIDFALCEIPDVDIVRALCSTPLPLSYDSVPLSANGYVACIHKTTPGGKGNCMHEPKTLLPSTPVVLDTPVPYYYSFPGYQLLLPFWKSAALRLMPNPGCCLSLVAGAPKVKTWALLCRYWGETCTVSDILSSTETVGCIALQNDCTTGNIFFAAIVRLFAGTGLSL